MAAPAPSRPDTVPSRADTAPVDSHQLAAATRDFVERVVYPVEREVVSGARPVDDALRVELQDAARAAGVFGPVSPRAHGGQGLDMRGQAVVLEAAGRSLLGPLAVHGSAPDDANIELLAAAADPGQTETHLAPLACGDVRSSIAMTEPPPGAGSDPTMLRTRAERDGGDWVVTGDKAFITGADGAAFAILVADTDEGATMFLVDFDAPGVTVGRHIPTIDLAAVGGHCEVRYERVRVPAAAVLGPVGGGLAAAQARLAPSRLTFCMKFLGLAARAHELACAHIGHREAFGTAVADHGGAQTLVADSEIDLAAARALVLDTAALLDREGPTSSAARHAASVTKTFVSEATWRVFDRAVQLHGSAGVDSRELVTRYFLEARAFRIYEGPSEVLRWSIARRALRAAR